MRLFLWFSNTVRYNITLLLLPWLCLFANDLRCLLSLLTTGSEMFIKSKSPWCIIDFFRFFLALLRSSFNFSFSLSVKSQDDFHLVGLSKATRIKKSNFIKKLEFDEKLSKTNLNFRAINETLREEKYLNFGASKSKIWLQYNQVPKFTFSPKYNLNLRA